MNSTAIRRIAAPSIVALTMGLSLAACGDNEAGTGSGETVDLSGTISGAGASSQEKAQGAWAIGFQGLTGGNVTVNYDAVGSGDGRKQFIAGGVDFAGTDSAFNDDDSDKQLSAAKERCGGEDIIQIPAYVSPIAIAYNLDGVDNLNLDAKTIAQIFDNKIKKWNDPAIAAQNEGVSLPDLAIKPVHRQDDSGTTKNFTDYLGKAGEGAWPYEAEDAFPVSGGEAAEGTSGVVSAVSAAKGGIGYADESQIGDLKTVSVKVGDGYTAPSAEGAALVVEASEPVEGAAETNMAIKLDRETTTAGAYPVVLLSYLVACQHYDDANKAALVKGYLSYVVSTEGQAASNEKAGSAPLSGAVATRAQSIVEKIAAK